MIGLIDKEAALFLVRETCLEILDRCDSHYDVDIEDYVYDDMSVPNAIIACKEKVSDVIDNMEPIDAIPVEWLKCKRYEHNNDGFGWIYDAVMDDWRKEGSTQVDHD